ncbi:MAG: stage V sporulation protein AA [Lachnotalea sp.]
MGDILYLKVERNIQVHDRIVTINHIAKMECSNSTVLSRIKPIKILNLTDKQGSKYVVSILKVLEVIHQIYPDLEIDNIGEVDFVIEYVTKEQNKIVEYLKIGMICIILFIGAAFTIMTFNNDVAVEKLFAQFYELVMNKKSNGFTMLEISYSVGLGIGILVFYNHIGGKRINTDPTPIQVEMRLYEDDVNTALIKNYIREDKRIDVD